MAWRNIPLDIYKLIDIVKIKKIIPRLKSHRHQRQYVLLHLNNNLLHGLAHSIDDIPTTTSQYQSQYQWLAYGKYYRKHDLPNIIYIRFNNIYYQKRNIKLVRDIDHSNFTFYDGEYFIGLDSYGKTW